ncbi:SOUL family heme-binding protein [Flavobacterium weaverense]|uniref:SOUL heme-binding protein n=1 Tax=Flavobacterium weaverense TaxID=271156 RepID=A0A3L9ZPK4_9FLAO|nr:heme-binding protein [Flavobacterium weaverense]RMA74951.1 SOUL heme-binding protein [Flavobacterium weaverense]
MKILYIILGITAVVFVAVQIFAISGQQNIETYSYKVVKKYSNFEVRNYEATLFTAVKMSGNKYKESSSKGFSVLAGYIFGGNKEKEKIAMTSPVAMSLGDSTTMMFMVPKKFKKETLPQPNESQIEFRDEPAKTVAAITFGGWADDQKIAINKQKLIEALEVEGIKYTNRFYFLGYNPPFEVFNRKNEIIVELEKSTADNFKS